MGKKFMNIIKMIKNDKRFKYTLVVTIMLLFISIIGYSLSFFNNNNSTLVANIKVNDLSFNMTTTSGESDDRILRLQAGKTESFYVKLKNINSINAKYELKYSVCSDSNCTNTSLDLPNNVVIATTPKNSSLINGVIYAETNNLIEIELLTLNSSDNDVYIKLDLNAGYEWNDLVLDNQFELLTSDKYTPDIDMNILAYVDGIEKDAYPNSCNYITKLKGYNGNTEVDITGSYAICDRETNTWQILVKGLVKKVVVNFIYQPGSPAFEYTGKFKIENGDTTDWKIYLLTSGTLTFTDETPNIDVFLVGGGGAGASGVWASGYVQVNRRSGGAGSGYTLTKKDISLDINTSYKIIIGEGGTSNAENTYTDGTATSAFSFTAKGGKGTKRDGEHYKGGDGGSGGGNEGYEGATDGRGGTNSGTGQGTTTREFGESQGKLYATGGSGISKKDGQPNTGDGGSGGRYADSQGEKIGSGGNGGSGIVVIRSHKIS